MKIEILGSTGYLGSCLKSSLYNYEVLTPNIRQSNVQLNGNVVINCIGETGDGKKKVDNNQYKASNVDVVKKVFSLFINSPATLLIHFSSISAIEELESSEVINEDTICKPISDYGKTKLEADGFLMSQKLPADKKIIILRPARVFGSNDKGSIKKLFDFVAKGLPYPFLSFENNRNFLYIENLQFLIEKIISTPSIEDGIYIACDDEYLSTVEIIKSFEKYAKLNVKKIFFPKFLFNKLAIVGDFFSLPFNTTVLKKVTSSKVLSNQKIKTALGIDKLPLTAEEGLEITIKSFKKLK